MEPRRILVVEPDERALAGLKFLLEQAGYRVVAVPDAESAAAIFHYLEPDLVVFAYPAPLGEGRSGLAEYVRRYPPAKPTRLLAMITRGHGDTAREALMVGCDAVCTRTVRPAGLIEKVAELIGSPLDPPGKPPDRPPPLPPLDTSC